MARDAPLSRMMYENTPIPFTKMHGLGNDYIYINCLEREIDEPEALARVLADRHTGIGGDGLILITRPEPEVDAHVRMRMFNADGSESEMCGNGIRCVCKFCYDYRLCTERPMLVQTGAGVLSLDYELADDGTVASVTVDMGEPVLEPARIPVKLDETGTRDRIVNEPIPDALLTQIRNGLDAGGGEQRMTCVSMGNPHVIIFCDDVAAVPLKEIGPLIERAALFPQRVNVHLVQVHTRDELTMRTWERGTGITRACGTGASAVCVAAVLGDRAERRVLIHLPGGDLHLHWDEPSNHVFKTGPAVEVFSGTWTPAAHGSPVSPGAVHVSPG